MAEIPEKPSGETALPEEPFQDEALVTEGTSTEVAPVEVSATEVPATEAPAGETPSTEAPPSDAAAEDPFESQLESITLKLQSFEGPLDLLVHLIKKNKMNVYDIQISVVTKQYLDYLNLMQELNLDVASEFLVMAATLIHIKSKMLLPRPETAAGDPVEEEDPRDMLVRRLLEHQKFKAAAELLHEKETLRGAQWGRPDSRIEAIAGDDYEPEIEVDLFSLLSAFKQVLERARERPPVLLPPEETSIESRIDQLLEKLSETEACGFEDLFEGDASRGDMIVTFLAMLEMIRLKLIRVFQQGGIGAIRVYKRARPSDAPHPIHDPEDEYKAHHPGTGPAPAHEVSSGEVAPQRPDGREDGNGEPESGAVETGTESSEPEAEKSDSEALNAEPATKTAAVQEMSSSEVSPEEPDGGEGANLAPPVEEEKNEPEEK